MSIIPNRRHFRFSLRTLFVVMAIGLAALIANACRDFYAWHEQTKSEYTTAQVILHVTEYVESHHGQWPQSWSDLPGGDHDRHYVRLRFDVDVDALIRDPDLIYTVIVPNSGVYRTYPHAKQNLNDLRKSLAAHRQQVSPKSP